MTAEWAWKALRGRAPAPASGHTRVLLAASLALSCLATGAAAAPASVADYVHRDLTAPGGRIAGASARLRMPDLLTRIYSERHDIPGWVERGAPRPTARALVDAVHDSRADGLQPRDYHLPALERLLTVPYEWLPPAGRARRLAALELLLSDAFLRLAHDEAQGRLDPATLAPQDPTPARTRVLREELQRIFAGTPPSTVLDELAPRDRDYRGLRGALARYRHLAASGEPPPVPAGPPLVEGDRGARVAALVARLRSAGDWAAGIEQDAFDARVAAALRRFQARHGLSVDGIAGKSTLTVLNRPAAYWIGKLRVNLERRRWLASRLPATRLMVNIADFHATLYVDGRPRLSEKVIVGRRYQQTPEFSSRISYLVVNPSWDVPASIAAKEILPAARRHRSYFATHDYEVLRGWGANERRVDPSIVDWKRLSAARLPYHFRQPAGPDNPLGRVKFMFPNSHDVYMHDTPARDLFDASRRTFSHGCIRVENAMRLAASLLRTDGYDDPGLLLIDAAGAGSNRRIELRRPVPVYIVYMTAWADDLNKIEFRPDVYGRDATVLAALDAPPFPSE